MDVADGYDDLLDKYIAVYGDPGETTGGTLRDLEAAQKLLDETDASLKALVEARTRSRNAAYSTESGKRSGKRMTAETSLRGLVAAREMATAGVVGQFTNAQSFYQQLVDRRQAVKTGARRSRPAPGGQDRRRQGSGGRHEPDRRRQHHVSPPSRRASRSRASRPRSRLA